ncbi:hypothetical protein, partial [Salmonella sp. s60093]|uniref:hypothetical protein n=1 Tax=Salmonella sp. s60093 TaxID=3159721 RepID=UPI003980E349
TSKPIEKCNNILHENYLLKESSDLVNKLKNVTVIIHAGAFTPKDGIESKDIEKSNSNINNTIKIINQQPLSK